MLDSQTPVAVVTGASRGVGRGVAAELTRCGFRVYATGRRIMEADLPSAVHRLTCDHTKDDQVRAAFNRVEEAAGGPDVLVNSVWGGYERMIEDGVFTWAHPFWLQPAWRWDAMMDAGVRAAFVASALAAPGMVAARRGLIVHISTWAAQKHLGNAIYGIAKAATDKMVADMAHELRDYGVVVVSLYPGLVRTEAVLSAGVFDLTNSESPEFSGKVIAALAQDPDARRYSGQVVIGAQLAAEYGLTDIDGKRPAPLSIV